MSKKHPVPKMPNHPPMPKPISCALCGYFCNNYHHHNNWIWESIKRKNIRAMTKKKAAQKITIRVTVDGGSKEHYKLLNLLISKGYDFKSTPDNHLITDKMYYKLAFGCLCPEPVVSDKTNKGR